MPSPRSARASGPTNWQLLTVSFDPEFDTATVETRPSKGGNYLGITITVTATSREQLDELYRTLTTHPMVKIVL